MAIGDPTGGDLASGTTNGNTLPIVTGEEREVSLGAGVALTSGVKYAIIVRATSGNGSNYVTWDADNGDNYAGGAAFESSNSGSSWTVNSGTNTDTWFKTKASAVEKDSYTHASVGTAFIYAANWYAQTFTAGSSYTIDAVVLKMRRVGSPGTITVSIRATVSGASKATTPAPANAGTGISLNLATLTWADGGGAATYDVYYGTQSGNLTLVAADVPVGSESFTITGITNGAPYSYLITRYWRVDAKANGQTTTGDEWSFTTLQLDAPSPVYYYAAGGYYYRLLTVAAGGFGNHPPTGVENTDYEVVTTINFIRTARKLVAAAMNKIWYEAT